MKYLIIVLLLISSKSMAYECLENIDLALKANPNLDVKQYALTHFQCSDKFTPKLETPDVVELQDQDSNDEIGAE
jgi:hypothetical protein